MDGPSLHRQHRDHALRELFSTVPGISLTRLGIRTPPMARELPADVKLIETAVEEADLMLEDEAGTVWVVEFESGGGDAARLLRHYAAPCQRHPGRRVELALFWVRARHPARVRPLRVQRASMAAHQTFLASLDGRAALQRLKARASAGLAGDDAIELALAPLMDHGERPMWDVLAELAPLATALPPAWGPAVVGAIGALGYDSLGPEERPRLLEVLGRMPFGQTLFADLRREGEELGKKRGALCKAREAVLEAFAARFDAVPTAVRSAVDETEDLDVLSRWHRAVIRAQTAADAERAVLEHIAAR